MINYPDSIRVYDDFLSEQNAYKIYAQLSSLPVQWFSLMRGSIDENNEPQQSKTWWNIHGDKTRAPDVDPMGRPTYQYLATNEHQAGCNCIYCDLTKLFNENPPPEATGLSVLDPALTLFRPGDYQSQWLDTADNTIWAFSYSLSVGWRPEWGGVLHAQDAEDSEWYAFPPVFNRLIMWDVTQSNTAVNTYISEIVSGCPVNRVNFTGIFGTPMGAQGFDPEHELWNTSEPVKDEVVVAPVEVNVENPQVAEFDPESAFNIVFHDDDIQDDGSSTLDEAS